MCSKDVKNHCLSIDYHGSVDGSKDDGKLLTSMTLILQEVFFTHFADVIFKNEALSIKFAIDLSIFSKPLLSLTYSHK